MNFKDWIDVINTNLISTYNVLNPVINNMRYNECGNVLFISSVLGKKGVIGTSNYSASKSAIYGLVKTLCLENSNKNILINSLSPGYFNDGMGLEFNEKMTRELNKLIPLNKFGNSNDLINIVDFLIEKNNYITGSNIDINGGII
jgi:NAD(P)-dependent dehydrogenase (short-subunit alcohol dehydrogenase family)